MAWSRALSVKLVACGMLAGVAALGASAQDGSGDDGLNPVAVPMPPMQSPGGGGAGGEGGAKADEKPEFPPFDAVSKGLEKVVSTADGSQSLYTLWASKKDGRLLAELPKNYEEQLIMIAPTVAGGDEEAGVMGGTIYANWKRIDKSLALIEPNYLFRSNGDNESKTSVKQLFTDRVILDVPIVALGPSGQPVIDLKSLFADGFMKFFGPGATEWGPMVMAANPRLAMLQSAKAFPRNIEVTYQMPGPGGRLVSMHYSLSELPENKSYKPRVADSRVGYFNVYYRDLGRPGNEQPYTRYITRWQLEKADPNLSKSPPKQPIVWYIEHTTPIRYRRFVREGILSWNDAFEQCGIINAVEVYQQDAETGAHMDKDPEDARYNFFRWNTSDQGYAIGPSRVDPRTGQIVDADVVWHAGLTNAIMSMLESLSAEVAVSGFTAETMEWLKTRPQWDPRVRLAEPAQRERMMAQLAVHDGHDHGIGHSGEPPADAKLLNGAHCKIGRYIAMDVGLVDAALAAGLIQAGAAEGENADAADQLDGLPEEFLGGMIRYVSAHEVGHCLGLQHNFSASTIRSLKDINSANFGEDQPITGSVMEYQGVNINFNLGDEQGSYATPGVGPYDLWAIAFGYGPEGDRDKVLARVSEPDLIFHNDMTMSGPDPRAMTWDMGADPLQFAESRMAIVKDLRGKIASDLVKDGQSWRKARQRYNALLSNQIQAMVIASRWVGGSYFNRDFKNDPGNRNPIDDIPAETQRRALMFVISNSFPDNALGLSPELLRKLGTEYYPDMPGFMGAQGDPSYTAHDAMAGVQATALTLIMNPTTLRRLYDNEFRTAGTAEANPLTLAEVMDTVTVSVWTEVEKPASGKFTASKPMISSFRRNLQREHVERLIDLSLTESAASSPAWRTIANLSTLKLRQINDQITKALASKGNLDEYTVAHLTDAQARITKALEAQYVYGR